MECQTLKYDLMTREKRINIMSKLITLLSLSLEINRKTEKVVFHHSSNIVLNALGSRCTFLYILLVNFSGNLTWYFEIAAKQCPSSRSLFKVLGVATHIKYVIYHPI